MKEYDFIFSLGFSCACTQSLRDCGLQKVSLPFDWVGTQSLLGSAQLVANDFHDWFERDALVLWDVRITGGFVSRVYKNVKTGIGFSHEFSNAEPIETHYEVEKGKYDRRIARLYKCAGAAKKILAVYLENSRGGEVSDEEILEARQILMKKFPHAEVDLLYLHEVEGCKVAEARQISEGVTSVALDYRTYLKGEIMHVCNMDMIRDYLRKNVAMVNGESEAERKAFADARRKALRDSLGKNRFDRWINRKMKNWFRDLEVYLEGQHLVPGDRPLWFDGDGK